jgi:hypothetical protein
LHGSSQAKSAFARELTRTMGLNPPPACLSGSPNQDVGCSWSRPLRGDEMRTWRGHLNGPVIRFKHRLRPIVTLQNATPVSVVKNE